jgi:hypothetical protein
MFFSDSKLLVTRNADEKALQSWIARPGDQFISHGKAVSSMLDAVAGKFTVQDLGQDFEHQVLISMCMVVVSVFSRYLAWIAWPFQSHQYA